MEKTCLFTFILLTFAGNFLNKAKTNMDNNNTDPTPNPSLVVEG